MATLKTDPRAISDMNNFNLPALASYNMTLTSTTVRYSDNFGAGVTFFGTGIGPMHHGVPRTQSVSGYTYTVQGIDAQVVTGLTLGPGEFESLMMQSSDKYYAQGRFWRGNDDLYGGNYADMLSGWEGNDRLYGGKGSDHLEGDNGNDKLYGGEGGDYLHGSNGRDTLIGGKGNDWLIGGTDADTFVFKALSDTGKDIRKTDTISDFDHGNDKIDLSAIDANPLKSGDQQWHFVTTTKATAGEIRAYQKDGWTYLEGHVDNDGRADFTIKLVGKHVLTASDFVL